MLEPYESALQQHSRNKTLITVERADASPIFGAVINIEDNVANIIKHDPITKEKLQDVHQVALRDIRGILF